MERSTDLTEKLVKASPYPFVAGLCCDIWKALDDSRQLVVVKAPRMSYNSPEQHQKMKTRILREIRVLSTLHHPNIVTMLGITYGFGWPDIPALVYPYYQEGDIVEYLSKKSPPVHDRLGLIAQVAAGLAYLHHKSIVHADIKGKNILMSDNGAVLCDFGLSRILDVTGFTTQSTGGTCRWMAPELLYPPDDDKEDTPAQPTTSSDIWAFAMTVLEIMTGRPPFLDKWTDVTVILTVISGGRPNYRDYRQIGRDLWDILARCWSSSPEERPTIGSVGLFFDLAFAKCPALAKEILIQTEALSRSPVGETEENFRTSDYPCQWPGCHESFSLLGARQKHEVEHANEVSIPKSLWSSSLVPKILSDQSLHREDAGNLG